METRIILAAFAENQGFTRGAPYPERDEARLAIKEGETSFFDAVYWLIFSIRRRRASSNWLSFPRICSSGKRSTYISGGQGLFS